MPSKYKYKSRASMEGTVKRFFAHTSDDTLSLDDAFNAWGRDMTEVEKNKQWFSNKLTNMKYYNLVTPVYTVRNNRRVLEQIQLTLEGKRVMGRVGENGITENGVQPSINGNGKKIDFKEAMDMIKELKRQNPDFEITFTAKLREGDVKSG
jgi:hypothetical protein